MSIMINIDPGPTTLAPAEVEHAMQAVANDYSIRWRSALAGALITAVSIAISTRWPWGWA